MNEPIFEDEDSAERYRNLRMQNESCSEVNGVSYRSGIYKMYMVRMIGISDKFANVRVYNLGLHRNVQTAKVQGQ